MQLLQHLTGKRIITSVACKYSPHLVMSIATYVSGPFLGHLPLGHDVKKKCKPGFET